jgi:hypothetical protein
MSITRKRILFVAALTLSAVAGFQIPASSAPLFQYASKATAMPTPAETADLHAAVPIWIPEPAKIIARDLCKEYKATGLFKKSKRALHDVNVSFTCRDPVALVSLRNHTIIIVAFSALDTGNCGCSCSSEIVYG